MTAPTLTRDRSSRNTPTRPAWDSRAAVEAIHRADKLVASLGVSGTDPEVQRLAGEVTAAHIRGDAPALFEKLAEFETAVRRIAAGGE